VKHQSRLKAGETAPDFSGIDQHGSTINLKDYTGKRVILYFYPKDSTPTCTTQACNLRDAKELLQEKGYVVLGVSGDDEKSHRKFSEKQHLNFSLLADVDRKIITAYDVWGEKVVFGREMIGIVRTTFVIDENGVIARVIHDVASARHAEQILE
jgi:thioredoxin-dependent peroxiredoxin